MRGHTFSAADEAHRFVGGGFDADVIGRNAEGGSDIGFHGVYVWGDFGRLGDQHSINIDQASAARFDLARGFLEEDFAGRILPLRIARWEKGADIAFANGAEHGIANGVH